MPGPDTKVEAAPTVGSRLRQVRDLRDKSLSKVAKDAHISTAYLQKLEAGAVKQPSPNVLHQLSEALDMDYAELMRLAGYVVPGDQRKSKKGRNELTYAFNSESLTDAEAEVLAQYLDWYRDQHRKS